MVKRVAMALVVAMAGASVASRRVHGDEPRRAGSAPRRRGSSRRPGRPATRDTAGDDDVRRGHGPVVRADGRSAAGEEVVAERLPGELRSRPGLHRRVELAGDVRGRRWGSGRDLWRVDAGAPRSTATSGRCSWRRSRGPAAWSTSIRSCGKAGPTTSWATSGSARRSTCCRSGGSSRSAFALRGHDEAADREGRRRRASAPGRRTSLSTRS